MDAEVGVAGKEERRAEKGEDAKKVSGGYGGVEDRSMWTR